ncbi:MAG TPA: hypothetical protein VK154_06870 [Chitinophagales bacterium]|nr:hypothetical protein [Chitinophagales bacterium]
MKNKHSNIPLRKIDDVVVIRPDYVWNTRSPFKLFIEYHKRETQLYWSSILMLKTNVESWKKAENLKLSSRKLFSNNFSSMYEVYTKTYGKKNNVFEDPTIEVTISTLSDFESKFTESSIVSYFSLFEMYMHCWTLNYILAKIESNNTANSSFEWTSKIDTLNEKYKPTSFTSPSVSQILTAFPEVVRALQNISYASIDPITKQEIIEPPTSNLNAFNAIIFWKEWRNLIVHRNGFMDSKFVDRHGKFWEDLRSKLLHLPKLRVDQRLKLNSAVYRTYTSTMYNTCSKLREIIIDVSKERRGHVHAPNKRVGNGKFSNELMPQQLPTLLMQGDHIPSFAMAATI